MTRYSVKQDTVFIDDFAVIKSHWIDVYKANEVDTRIQELEAILGLIKLRIQDTDEKGAIFGYILSKITEAIGAEKKK